MRDWVCGRFSASLRNMYATPAVPVYMLQPWMPSPECMPLSITCRSKDNVTKCMHYMATAAILLVSLLGSSFAAMLWKVDSPAERHRWLDKTARPARTLNASFLDLQAEYYGRRRAPSLLKALTCLDLVQQSSAAPVSAEAVSNRYVCYRLRQMEAGMMLELCSMGRDPS